MFSPVLLFGRDCVELVLVLIRYLVLVLGSQIPQWNHLGLDISCELLNYEFIFWMVIELFKPFISYWVNCGSFVFFEEVIHFIKYVKYMCLWIFIVHYFLIALLISRVCNNILNFIPNNGNLHILFFFVSLARCLSVLLNFKFFFKCLFDLLIIIWPVYLTLLIIGNSFSISNFNDFCSLWFLSFCLLWLYFALLFWGCWDEKLHYWFETFLCF